jgi:hypothetical protein
MDVRRRLVVGASLCAIAAGTAASARADDERGIDPNQGQNLVEVALPSKAAAVRLQLEAETYGVEFNDHYLRQNGDGSVTVTVFGTDDEIDSLADAGYEIGVTIEGPNSWRKQVEARQTAIRKETRAAVAATGKPTQAEVPDADAEIVVLRADYFENYAGRFLSVEAKTRDATINPATGAYTGPSLSLSWNTGAGTPIDATPRQMNLNIDPDTTPDTYIEHRELVRIGGASSTDDVPTPTRIRIGSSTGEAAEADVKPWLDGGLPPMTPGRLTDFTTRYLDPTEVYARFDALAAEFPNLAQMIDLPNQTNGYQRRAQANMAGTLAPGNTPSGAQAPTTVVLTSRAWGHEGGNDLTAAFVNPGVANAPLSVSVAGNDLTVNLATNAAGELSSTAAQVVAAINAHPAASQRLVATTYRNNAGAGVVAARTRVNLSDFLTTATNAHVQRGPFQYSVMRIGKRDPDSVGVFLYCQQHAREWATPLTCLETAEQLLRNYAIDPATKRLVDNLDIFILPSSNPDGGHYSMHNFGQQRRNLTNHCVEGGKETDNANAANFWQPRSNPITAALYGRNDPSSRNAWGVDLNRNNTFGTIFDGYIGASGSCDSDVFAGPAEASEPEIKNELWVADTFPNIKFSNNIHSFGGYFMWAPGTYLPDRGEGDAVHANIGIEKYFFAAGDRILNRIKGVRDTAILPERTGPIADVLYSAAGNSADEHWYNRDVIAYSFETGADIFGPTALSQPAAAGATAIRLATRTGFDTGDEIVIGSGATAETKIVASVAATNPPNPQPNVTLTTPLANAHLAGELATGGTTQVGVGFQPPYDSEGKFEALEFAAGNYGLLESAYDYAFDTTPPQVRMPNGGPGRTEIRTTFEFVNEPSVIHYTLDNSTPTESSALWDASGPREPGEIFEFTETTTVKWRAEDIKGNVSYGKEKFVITGPK